MEKGIGIVILLLLTSVTVLSQDLILYNFDDGIHVWNTKKGKAEIVEQGAYSHKALRLVPNTTVVFELLLRPASSYKLVAWMRTESGTDDMSMQITNLGRNNIGITNALATWTRFERIFNVSDNQVKGNLEFTFDNSQGNTFVWRDSGSFQTRSKD